MSRSAERFGRRSWSNESPDSIQWRRDDATCENEAAISVPVSASSSTLTEGPSSSATNLSPASVSQLFDPLSPGSSAVAQTTNPALPLSTAVPVVEVSFGGVYRTVTGLSLTGVPPTDATQIASSSGSLVNIGDASTASLAATSSSFGSLTRPVFSAPADPVGGALSLVFSTTVTFSAATVFQASGAITSVPTDGPSAASSGHSQASDSSPDSASSTGDSTNPVSVSSDFPAQPTSSSFSPSTTSATSSILSTGISEPSNLTPTAPNSSLTGKSTISSGLSSSSSFHGVLPGPNTMSPGTSPSAASATSHSLSRTFAHNTGGIAGVTVGVAMVLFLGVLFTFWVRRKKSPSSRPWISSPLLYDNDGLNDAYSPVARRHSGGRSPDFVRPLSFQSVDRGVVLDGMEPNATRIAENAQYDTNNEHYDTDTWTIPALTGPLASNSPSLSPEFYAPSTPSPTSLTSPPTALQPAPSPIGAKGFMRRLRRGRPPMASRGLLTTLAPVVESGRSSVAEISRPPSSQHSMVPTLVSRAPPTALSNNYSLPWIHRRRSGGPEMTQAALGATWAV